MGVTSAAAVATLMLKVPALVRAMRAGARLELRTGGRGGGGEAREKDREGGF